MVNDSEDCSGVISSTPVTESAVALIEMIETQKAEMSFEMDVYSSLWYVFHGMVLWLSCHFP